MQLDMSTLDGYRGNHDDHALPDIDIAAERKRYEAESLAYHLNTPLLGVTSVEEHIKYNDGALVYVKNREERRVSK